MENELIRLAQNGDVDAFEQLIKQHQTIVYNVALRIMGNSEDAADAAQEALVKVYKNINKFKGDSKFSTWIYRIVHNVCLDELRKRKNKYSHIVRSIDESFEDGENPILSIADDAPTPEQQVISDERQKFLLDAINKLAPISRSAVMLRDVNGLSYDEIAKIQNCSLGTVKSRINRARLQLKDIIVKQNY